ncbi:MAG: MBOAT family O-acyltransferase [Bradymonadia bacterium]
MLFPTIEFGIFFALVLPIAWALRSRRTARKWFLVTMSYVFYGFWDWRFTLLLLQCSAMNYGMGLWLQNSRHKQRQIVTLAVSLNLLTLGFFKYYGFFVSSFNSLLTSVGAEREIPIFEIVLPVGISFFTFQGMSYVIDIYRKNINARRKLVDVLLYISFFPQLVAGPIVRAKDFLHQVDRPLDKMTLPSAFAFKLIVIGLFKKVVIANYLSTLLVDDVFADPSRFSSIDVLFGIYGYAVQIYCDFSAYTDIAIGVAALLGYQFLQNFDSPYRATSLQNFWRRWHISLSTWLRDYLYISLGGSRGSSLKTNRNLFLTMFLGGLWHGAAWNFVIWGVLHGLALGLERIVVRLFGSFYKPRRIFTAIRIILVFHFVCLTWIFFRASDLDLALEILNQLSQRTDTIEQLTPLTFTLIVVGFVGQFIPQKWEHAVEHALANRHPITQSLILVLALGLLGSLAPEGVAPFIYFQF